ncbi:hypothetical protein VCUG_00836 [Vavraia culicis subsp. floridensis]|uniref:N-acetyltransferase domain-containing protein n=1 Tax=Vavraia culicis (isolate floridensis) TaxID=948595 RepID=L2GX09_VAVCU|nr:uncharacterized protein VCUG_00836 [Vavraia culicis subsp. floridensis]ELA47635.1 hypothetical protein VCUG_00836 [Vavraia culicis subsp. floridensis]
MVHARNLVPKSIIKPICVSSKNIEILKHLDLKIFPIKYKNEYYQDLLTNKDKHSFLFIYNNEYIGEASYDLCHVKKRCYLMTLGVVNEYRSHGLGSQILSFVENMVRGERVERIYLHVQLKNMVASRFYLKWSYRVVKIEKDYYTKLDSQCAIVLCKYL